MIALDLTDHICDNHIPPHSHSCGIRRKIEAMAVYLVVYFYHRKDSKKAAAAPVKPVTVQEEFIQSQQLMNICSALVALRSVVPRAQRKAQLIMSNPQVQPASVPRQEKEIRTNFLFATCAIQDC